MRSDVRTVGLLLALRRSLPQPHVHAPSTDPHPTAAIGARAVRPRRHAARATDPTRADALGRIAAKVSGRRDLTGLFDDIIDEAFALFGVDRAGLWTYDPTGRAPLALAAQRGLPPVIIEAINSLPEDARTAGMDATADAPGPRPRSRHALDDAAAARGLPGDRRRFRLLRAARLRRRRRSGCSSCTTARRTAGRRTSAALARAFGDHMATAIGTARLAESRRGLADRLSSIAELAGRLSRLHDRASIAAAIVEEAKRLIEHDTIRVYRVDHATGMCEPIAFEGTFLGTTEPDLETLRMPIGAGPDRLGRRATAGRSGWATPRATRACVVVGDATVPSRCSSSRWSRTTLVHGVIVVSALGHRPLRRRRRGDADDLRRIGGPGPGQRREPGATAAPAGRARAPARGPAPPPRGQRAAAVDARPGRRARPHRRLAQGDRPVRLADHLPGRPRGRRPARRHRPRPLRRRDPGPREPARRRASPAGSSSTARRSCPTRPTSTRARSRSRARRSSPSRSSSCPLLVNGETIGTLNIGRIGEVEAHFSPTSSS